MDFIQNEFKKVLEVVTYLKYRLKYFKSLYTGRKTSNTEKFRCFPFEKIFDAKFPTFTPIFSSGEQNEYP